MENYMSARHTVNREPSYTVVRSSLLQPPLIFKAIPLFCQEVLISIQRKHWYEERLWMMKAYGLGIFRLFLKWRTLSLVAHKLILIPTFFYRRRPNEILISYFPNLIPLCNSLPFNIFVLGKGLEDSPGRNETNDNPCQVKQF
jgi:hypothetical protein